MSKGAWSYIINYGPDGEQNWANVFDADQRLVGNLRIHHAVDVVAACNARIGVPGDTNDAMVNAERVSFFRSLPGYPWLNPCPRCGYSRSCDCTVLERARAAHPGLVLPANAGDHS